MKQSQIPLPNIKKMAVNSTDKILIIGLDGVDPDLLDKFMQEGILPNLKRIIDSGAYGRIKSSIPIITTVTWTSFITGKNPGRHGIFGFIRIKNDSYDLKILNSRDRKEDGIWSALNQYGKTVGIFNLPSLYPPEKIDKFMVCGMLTPNKKCRFVYPPELQEELLKEIKDYEIDLGVIKAADGSRDILLKNIYFLTDKRFEATEYLLKKYPCDLFITIITETDRVQHYFFNDDKLLRDYFKYLDAKLGNLLQDLDKDTTVFILSDHGMGPFKKFFYINKWLQDHGLLKINKQSTDYLKHSLARKMINWITTILVRLKFDVEKLKQVLPEELVNHFVYLYCHYGGVDWPKSKAYFCSTAGEGIIINSKKRFSSGIVQDKEYELLRDKIIKRLSEIRDPDTGKQVIEAIYKKEELFSGKALSDAPDILLQLYDGYLNNESIEVEGILQAVPKDETLIADHRLHGIFIAAGSDIKAGVNVKNFSILDIAPTIFYKLGIPVPQDFDGRILKEIFKAEIINSSPQAAIKEKEQKKTQDSSGLSEEEEKQVKETLKKLGYL